MRAPAVTLSSIMVAGAGSWGTALALALARNGRRVFLWDCVKDHARRLAQTGRNDLHLPGHPFPPTLTAVTEFTPLPAGTGYVVIATPCAGLRAVLEALRDGAGAEQLKLCLACKGLQPDTLSLNHAVAEEVLPGVPVAVLSGPSFAAEVAAGLPTAVTIAAAEAAVAAEFAGLFHSEAFRAYTHDDLIGAQVGGAVKNVMAIAAGVSDGLGFGANARAALMARGLAEIMRLGLALGARDQTFMGLTGVGDLALTCTDDQSRNRRFGMALAQGQTPEQAQAAIGQAVEGAHTARAVCELAARHGVDMPISRQVLRVIDGELSPAAAVRELLARARKSEA